MDGSYWQTGVIVRDLDAAMNELGGALGLTWSKVAEYQFAGMQRRVAFSQEGPPYVELIEDGQADPAPRIDHLGWWSDDVEGDVERVRATGAEIVLDGRLHGRAFVLLRGGASGVGMELIDRRFGPVLAEQYGIAL
jgi:hypothetical protein